MDPDQPQQPKPQPQEQPPHSDPEAQPVQQASADQTQSTTPPASQPESKNSGSNPPQNQENGTSNTRNIIAILLLVFVPIIGLFYVLLFTKWPKWVKIALSLIFILPFMLILLAIILIMINPARQFGQADDTKRQSATIQILNAVGAYHADNYGELPPEIPSTPQEISSSGADICEYIVPSYIPALPVDPYLENDEITDCEQTYSTGYLISVDSEGRVTVSAPMTEGDVEISKTR